MDGHSHAALATVCGNRGSVVRELRQEVVRHPGQLLTLQEKHDGLVHVHRLLLDCHCTALGMLESLSHDPEGVVREEGICLWRALAHVQTTLADIMAALVD